MRGLLTPLVASMLLASCYGSEYLFGQLDSSTVDSSPWDTGIDEPDVPPDTVPADTSVDLPPDTGSCTYPSGPYAFNAVGDIPGPATWPDSMKGTDETYPLDHADLNEFYCDPAVQSILVFHATLG